MNRAQRRHDYRRLQQVRRYYWGFGDVYKKEAQMNARTLGKVMATPHPCSCMGCGSPRRVGELTMQEKRFACEVA